MKHSGVVLWLLMFFSLVGASPVFAQERAASVSAELSSDTVAFGDTVSLTVTSRNTNAAIDLSSLHSLFTVTGRSSSRGYNNINGVDSSSVSWSIQLAPKQMGSLTVPPIKVGDLSTEPMALRVTGPPTGTDRVLFVELSVDNETPYVQSQVLMTVKVWQSVKVLESRLVNLGSDQFEFVALERDREYVDSRDGKEYLVQEQQFALFPQASGEYTFGPLELNANIPVDGSRVQGFFTPTRSVKRLSEAVALSVRARPDDVQGQWWLPARDVTISDSWSVDPENISANDAVTRTLEISATGVGADQMPDIEPPVVDGLKLYADKTDSTSIATEEGIVTTQRITWVVVPERNGDVRIPPISINWFNTLSEQSELAEVPARTVTVNGLAAQAAPVLAPRADGASSDDVGNADAPGMVSGNIQGDAALIDPLSPSFLRGSRYPSWLWVLLGAAGLLLLQAAVFAGWKCRALRSQARFGKQSAPNARDGSSVPSLREVSRAAQSHSAGTPAALKEFQRAVLRWAEGLWPQTPPNNLLNIAQRLNEPELHELFSQVDAALYGSSDSPVNLSRSEELLRRSASRVVDAHRISHQRSELPML